MILRYVIPACRLFSDHGNTTEREFFHRSQSKRLSRVLQLVSLIWLTDVDGDAFPPSETAQNAREVDTFKLVSQQVDAYADELALRRFSRNVSLFLWHLFGSRLAQLAVRRQSHVLL